MLPHPSPAQTPDLLYALAHLNRLGVMLNRATADPQISEEATLRLIAGGAVELVQMAAGANPSGPSSDSDAARATVSAVIYTCEPTLEKFDAASQVVAGAVDAGVDDAPRAAGLGVLALRGRRRVISYEEPGLELHPAIRAAGAHVGVCYPLIAAEHPVGVLYIYLHEQRSFSELDLLLLDNFVNQATIVIHRAQQLARVRRNLERKEDELRRLRHADLLISSRLRLQETLEAILQMALEVTGARYGILRLVESTGQDLITRAIAGDDLGRPAMEALPINTTSITGWAAKHREPVCIADVRDGRWSQLYYPLDHEMEMRSELAVPLVGAGGRLEGVINLESPQVGAFSEEDSLLLQSLATQAVIALQDVRLLDAVRELAEWLLTQPAQQVFDRIVQLASELLNVPVSALWTLEGDTLLLQSATAGHRHGERVGLHGSLTGEAVLSRGPVISVDVSTDARFQWTELARAQGWTQALVVPLLAGDDRDPVGALSVYNTVENLGQFSSLDWATKVLTFLAHHAALAVQANKRQEALQLAREQRAAAETFAAVGDIAANLLHRLNNKIGTIPVRVEGIQDKSRLALDADEYLARNLYEIERSAVDAMEIMRDSVSILRPLHLTPVNVAASVEEAMAEAKLPEGVSVHVEGLSTLPLVLAGQHRLALVFLNLVENAATAMDGRGEIFISGDQRNGWVEVTVRDTGPGIAPELHERIFEFSYSGAMRSGKLGFGLWWVKTLMARFGGTINVESDGRSGTTFVLRLPAERDES